MSDAATFDYELPSLGADMDVGRVVEWRVAIGDEVSRGDIMAVVETEKSDIDIEIWHDGVVQEFLVELGDEIAVGTPIVRLAGAAAERTGPDEPGGAAAPVDSPPTSPFMPSPSPTGAPAGLTAPPSTPPVSTPPPAAATSPAAAPHRVLASPRARRLAAERGVDLTTVTGTGPGGAVIASDLGAAAPAPSPPAPSPSSAPDRMRTMIATRMSLSNREIPHYHLALDVDLSALDRWLAEWNESAPITERILPAAAFVRAVALALAEHRDLNGHWVDDRFVPAEAVNVAMAVSLRRGGLVTPKVEHADRRSVSEIMAELREHVTAARTGSLKASWMTGSTITVTNLGDHGADLVHGVISPPEVALVGIGRPTERPWVVDGSVTVRRIVTLTLAADHRASDGATGSRFLRAVADLLEHPEEL
jgi:pyruvate dehydrogenase E2 component (dihydrolipoamide acetyltransferase)